MIVFLSLPHTSLSSFHQREGERLCFVLWLLTRNTALLIRCASSRTPARCVQPTHLCGRVSFAEEFSSDTKPKPIHNPISSASSLSSPSPNSCFCLIRLSSANPNNNSPECVFLSLLFEFFYNLAFSSPGRTKLRCHHPCCGKW